jgi:hypothetical protein
VLMQEKPTRRRHEAGIEEPKVGHVRRSFGGMHFWMLED